MPTSGSRVYAADLAGLTVVTDTSTVGSAASGFTVATIVARTALSLKLVYFKLDIVNTSAITSTSGDIPDTTIYTLNANYRPSELCNFHFTGGAPNGDVQVNTDGTVVIRSANVSIPASSNLRMAFTYLKA